MVPAVDGKPIELILLRQWALRLPYPAILVDAAGVLIFANPAAERLLGYRLTDLGEVPLDALEGLTRPCDSEGRPLAIARMPIAVALRDRRPSQSTLIVHSVDGVAHHIVTTAIPLDGQGGVLLGAMSIFWEQ